VLNYLRPVLLSLACVLLSTVAANGQTLTVRDQVTLKGTVEAIDATARTLTIRGDRGNVVTVDIPKSVTRFEELKVGDGVSVTYFDRVNVRAHPPGEPAVDRTEPPLRQETPGALPGATVATQRTTTVTITSWDPATRVVTFTDPAGTAYSRRIAETTDMTFLAGLKAGDRVDVTRTEAVRLDVQRSTVSVDATEDLRNRLTISLLVGLDNNFTGNMIEASTGQTSTGRAIDLNDVTYDDVYGRMEVYKAGVGYRTSPRSEVVVNFALSRSDAQRVTIGTIGPDATPLHVDFDSYKYWGVEGGQRFFFTRVRFTPFVGYLVGLNRYDDIRGTFVDVPIDATPGLAAQDGKFFEKSWAFSLGPTGGFLIGLGPLELMAEAQLRYMGGLSDVDWLVDEGLRDINGESARWSIPVLVGVRIRF